MAKLPEMTIKMELTEPLKERLDRIEQKVDSLFELLKQPVTINVDMDAAKAGREIVKAIHLASGI